VALTGGERLQAKLREIAGDLAGADEVDVGFLAGSTYPDGTSTSMVAAIHEFGAPKAGIPPRPFFRSMIAAKAPKWGEQMGKVLNATGFNATATLEGMGALIKGQLQRSIRDIKEPPLSQATIDAKGFDKPLIETGHMVNSVDYEVKS
jgi:hypothetical protein